jgi:hypothetical protein
MNMKLVNLINKDITICDREGRKIVTLPGADPGFTLDKQSLVPCEILDNGIVVYRSVFEFTLPPPKERDDGTLYVVTKHTANAMYRLGRTDFVYPGPIISVGNEIVGCCGLISPAYASVDIE